jgi:hypothetical protein
MESTRREVIYSYWVGVPGFRKGNNGVSGEKRELARVRGEVTAVDDRIPDKLNRDFIIFKNKGVAEKRKIG